LLPVSVILEDQFLPVAPVYDVADHARVLNSQLAGYARKPLHSYYTCQYY
jgi:hypothetical protein